MIIFVWKNADKISKQRITTFYWSFPLIICGIENSENLYSSSTYSKLWNAKARKQAQAGNSIRHLRDIRRGVTDRRTDGRTDGRTDRPTDGPTDRPTDGQTLL